MVGKLDQVLVEAFNESEKMKTAVGRLTGDLTQALKSVGALESSLSCHAFIKDFDDIHTGLCFDGMSVPLSSFDQFQKISDLVRDHPISQKQQFMVL